MHRGVGLVDRHVATSLFTNWPCGSLKISKTKQGNLGVLLESDRCVEELLWSHQGCQYRFAPGVSATWPRPEQIGST